MGNKTSTYNFTINNDLEHSIYQNTDRDVYKINNNQHLIICKTNNIIDKIEFYDDYCFINILNENNTFKYTNINDDCKIKSIEIIFTQKNNFTVKIIFI